MIHDFNLTLLGKLMWKLVQFSYSLLARVHGKYFRFISPVRVNHLENPSYIWTSKTIGSIEKQPKIAFRF